jgi:hypothetical protein
MIIRSSLNSHGKKIAEASLPLVGLVVSTAITAEFPQGGNLPYSIFGATKVKLELFFEKISQKKYGEDSHKEHEEKRDGR